MSLVKCSECSTEVSTKATTCSKCGAPVKRKSGCLGTLGAGLLMILALGAVASASRSCSDSSSSASHATASPTVATASGPDYMHKVGVLRDAMRDMNANTVSSIEGVGLALDVFSAGADLIRQGKSMQLSEEDRKQVEALRTVLLKRQVTGLPLLRRKMGPFLAKQLWESDVKARTFGDSYTTVEFVGGAFAAHHNIQTSQDAASPFLSRLRFKRAQYKWIESAEEFTFYKLDTLPDNVLAVIDKHGSVTWSDSPTEPSKTAATGAKPPLASQ